MRVTNAAGIVAFVLIGITASAVAQQRKPRNSDDWAQWRGPARTNLSMETGLLKQWPENGPPLAWKASGIGSGYSTISVAGDRIYTMGDVGDSSYVHALERDGGKKAWSTKVGRPGGDRPGTRSTPTVAAGRVYALGQWGDLVCLDAATGKEHWRKNLEKDFGGRMMSGWGYSESVFVDDQKVICTPGGDRGAIVALDIKTGDLIWRTEDFTDEAAYSSIVPAEIGGKRQYVQLTGESVVGVAADTGDVLWRAKRHGETAVISTPVVKGNFIFVTSGYGIGCNLFRVTPSDGKFSAEQVYANRDMENHHGGVVLVGDHIYGTSGNMLVCMELITGKVAWKDRSVGKGAVSYADGHLYVRSEGGDGTLALVEATPQAYREKGRCDQPDRSNFNAWPQPVIAGGKLYVRDQDVLLCYDVTAR